MTIRRDVTQVLLDTSGKPDAVDHLFPVVYDELRRLAQNYLANERANHTLRATELVNEAYLRLVDQTRVDWKNRAHFFAVAARAMRRILIDHARRRARVKRGGGVKPFSIDEALTISAKHHNTDLVALDEALNRLEGEQPEKARVVELRFFSGMTAEEAAEVLGVTPRTVWRHWQFAQAYLYRELTGE
jgi:RNA polymerase sigma factor (TIGR02999 family)